MRWTGSKPTPVDCDHQWTAHELDNIRAAAFAELKGRIILAILLPTMPVWFFPVLLWLGFREFGIHELRSLPSSVRYIMKGERFPTLGAFAVWRNPSLVRKPGPIVRGVPKPPIDWD